MISPERNLMLSPDSVHKAFEMCLNANDLESLLDLYESRATVVDRGGDQISGREAIGDYLADLLSIHPRIKIEKGQRIDAGDISVLIADWQLTGTSPDGTTILDQGRTYDIVRRQPDQTWKIVIDNAWSVEPAD